MSDRPSEPETTEISGERPGYPNGEILVNAVWLSRHLEDPNLRLLDVRPAERYGEGHIPRAISAPVDLFKTARDGVPAMAIDRDRIEQILGSLGVSNDSTVVIYEESSGWDSARLFWTLEYYGHRDVRIVDGGFLAWTSAGLPIARDLPDLPATRYVADPRPERLATWRDVKDTIGREGSTILDTRSRAEYTGEEVRLGTARGGHVPGAAFLDWREALTAQEPRRMKPAEELRELFHAAGVTPDREVITYCRTGQRASHTYFALRLLGYPRVRMYDGSWTEWSNMPELPAER